MNGGNNSLVTGKVAGIYLRLGDNAVACPRRFGEWEGLLCD